MQILAAVFALSLALPAQTTHNVGPGGFSQIRDAIAVASAGDRIVVAPGTYATFFDNVGVTILAATSGTVQIAYSPLFPNCSPPCLPLEGATRFAPPAGATSHVIGLGFPPTATFVNGLQVFNRVVVEGGHVIFDQCTMEARSGSALRSTNATVHMVLTSVRSNDAPAGEAAAAMVGSIVTAVECQFYGPPSSVPGPGIELTGTTMTASFLYTVGGTGAAGPSGPGAPAFRTDSRSRCWLSDCTFIQGSRTTCARDFGGAAYLMRSTSLTASGCSPNWSIAPLLGIRQAAPLVGGQPFQLLFKTTPASFVGVLVSPRLSTQTSVPELTQPWFAPPGSATYALLFPDRFGSVSVNWPVPAALVGGSVWLHAASGEMRLPLQVAPPVGGFVR